MCISINTNLSLPHCGISIIYHLRWPHLTTSPLQRPLLHYLNHPTFSGYPAIPTPYPPTLVTLPPSTHPSSHPRPLLLVITLSLLPWHLLPYTLPSPSPTSSSSPLSTQHRRHNYIVDHQLGTITSTVPSTHLRHTSYHTVLHPGHPADPSHPRPPSITHRRSPTPHSSTASPCLNILLLNMDRP